MSEVGVWLLWDGQRWRRDDTGEIVRLAKETVRAITSEASTGDEQLFKALLAHMRRSETEAQLRGMVNLAATERGIPVRSRDLDADPWLLNAQNGTIDLKTGSVRPHDAADGITKLAPVRYNPFEAAGRWDAFLRQVLPDPKVRAFVKRAVGYAASGDTREEALFFLHGPPATGKSTFLEALKGALGDYAMTANFDTFLRRITPGGPRNDLARLIGARFVTAAEVDDGQHMDTGVVKSFTGRDTVTARFLYKEAFEFPPNRETVSRRKRPSSNAGRR